MRNLSHRVFFSILLFFLGTGSAFAVVTITAATLGTNISADRAANAIAPLWTTLGQIRIQEGVNGDIPANQSGVTRILTAPNGWKFRAGSGTFAIIAGRDITAITGAVTDTTITTRFTTDALANASDRITITNIQVQNLSGHLLGNTGRILRTSANPGTAVIAGITNDVSNFGSLSQVTGIIRMYDIVWPGQTFTPTVGIQGSPSMVGANIAFVITKIRAVDQFHNIVTTHVGAKTLTYSNVSAASGANTFTTTATFTAGGSTTVLNTTLRTPGQYSMKIANAAVVSGFTSNFVVGNNLLTITAPSAVTLPPIMVSTGIVVTSGVTATPFTIEDQKGSATGHYTTIQCGALSGGIATIPNTSIDIQSLGYGLITGTANPRMTGYLTTPTTCNGSHVLMERTTGGSGAGIFSVYGANLKVTVNVPAYQNIGNYSGTIVYTLISY